jgi:anti-sigma factor RsiW
MTDVDHSGFEQDFSDYYEKQLPPARMTEVEKHLEGCQRCKEEYERFLDTMRSISGLHRMSAPQDFEKQVAETIHRRSAGRFFGRRAFGDRVPFELLALAVLALCVVVYLLMRTQ